VLEGEEELAQQVKMATQTQINLEKGEMGSIR